MTWNTGEIPLIIPKCFDISVNTNRVYMIYKYKNNNYVYVKVTWCIIILQEKNKSVEEKHESVIFIWHTFSKMLFS